MEDQKLHLHQLVEQQNKLIDELQKINFEANVKKELLLKTQGAIEYLQQIGVTLSQTEQSEEINHIAEVE
jgi:hypothetical protein